MKPLKIWPVWIVSFLIMGLFDLLASAKGISIWLWGNIILSCLIYHFNVTNFGKKYWKKKE